MKLYHFTGVTLAESIFVSALNEGHVRLYGGGIFQPVVWLTTYPLHNGHGLLTGNEVMTERDLRSQTVIRGARPRNNKTLDKTRIRIEVDSGKLPKKPVRYETWSKQNGEPALHSKLMGLSACYDLEALSDENLLKAVRKQKTRLDTWFLSFDPIPPTAFERVSFRVDNDQYVDYDFETHGRPGCEEQGIAIVSSIALSSLRAILPAPHHRFDQGKASVVVVDPHDERRCLIRCAEFTLICAIDAPQKIETILGAPPDNLPAFTRWIQDQKSELDHCYQRALDAYFRFYPQEEQTSVASV